MRYAQIESSVAHNHVLNINDTEQFCNPSVQYIDGREGEKVGKNKKIYAI